MKFHATGKVLSLWPGPFVALWLCCSKFLGAFGWMVIWWFFCWPIRICWDFHGLMQWLFWRSHDLEIREGGMWIRRISFVSAVLRLPTLTWEKQVAGLPGFVYILYYKYIDIYIHTNMYQFVVDYMDVSQNYRGSHPVSIAWKWWIWNLRPLFRPDRGDSLLWCYSEERCHQVRTGTVWYREKTDLIWKLQETSLDDFHPHLARGVTSTQDIPRSKWMQMLQMLLPISRMIYSEI